MWDDEADALGSNTLDVHMARLRAKISNGGVKIEAVRALGYRIVAGMKVPPRWRSPIIIHAARVALVATVIIGAMYVCVVAGFDAVDRHRLVAQIDTRLEQRLDDATRQPASLRARWPTTTTHTTWTTPRFSSGKSDPMAGPSPSPLELRRCRPRPGPPRDQSNEARLGAANFRLQSRHVNGTWFVVGQSLAQADHVESDLTALEVVAGPVLLLGVFLGTLLIGIKAASPVEQARRRQLEFTADASHELRTPLSVIEAEVSLALSSPRTIADYRDTLGRVSRETLRLRDIVEDLLWLSRFDSEPPPPGDEPVDVGAIALACADRFDAVAAGRGISLSRAPTGWRVSRGSMPLPNGSIGSLASWSTTPVATPGTTGSCDITVMRRAIGSAWPWRTVDPASHPRSEPASLTASTGPPTRAMAQVWVLPSATRW